MPFNAGLWAQPSWKAQPFQPPVLPFPEAPEWGRSNLAPGQTQPFPKEGGTAQQLWAFLNARPPETRTQKPNWGTVFTGQQTQLGISAPTQLLATVEEEGNPGGYPPVAGITTEDARNTMIVKLASVLGDPAEYYQGVSNEDLIVVADDIVKRFPQTQDYLFPGMAQPTASATGITSPPVPTEPAQAGYRWIQGFDSQSGQLFWMQEPIPKSELPTVPTVYKPAPTESPAPGYKWVRTDGDWRQDPLTWEEQQQRLAYQTEMQMPENWVKYAQAIQGGLLQGEVAIPEVVRQYTPEMPATWAGLPGTTGYQVNLPYQQWQNLNPTQQAQLRGWLESAYTPETYAGQQALWGRLAPPSGGQYAGLRYTR